MGDHGRTERARGGCGCWGIVSFVLFLIVLWALVFGVEIDGRRYGVSCSTDRGVVVHTGDPVPATPEAPK